MLDWAITISVYLLSINENYPTSIIRIKKKKSNGSSNNNNNNIWLLYNIYNIVYWKINQPVRDWWNNFIFALKLPVKLNILLIWKNFLKKSKTKIAKQAAQLIL